MAIKKPTKQVNYLGSSTVEPFHTAPLVAPDTTRTDDTSEENKSSSAWGRPRRQLIDGVKEKTISVQLPETLLQELKMIMKREKKSMKELIGEALIKEYMTPNTNE